MLNVSGSTMGAEVGLVSMTQIQKLSQSQHHKNHPHPPLRHHNQQNPNSTTTTTTTTTTWMWNPKDSNQEEDDSWEVRAFAEDTRNIMGTTWPPRSYTCTFCGREFRSAQALGGHMNVHRRDRARLHHQAQPPPVSGGGGSVTPTFINVPAQELVANAGLCFLYHLPSPNSTTTTTTTTTFHSSISGESPSTLLSISSSSSPHYPPNNNSIMMQSYLSSAAAATVGINGVSSSYNCCNSSKVAVEEPVITSSVNNGLHLEELDLELRLGHKPTPT